MHFKASVWGSSTLVKMIFSHLYKCKIISETAYLIISCGTGSWFLSLLLSWVNWVDNFLQLLPVPSSAIFLVQFFFSVVQHSFPFLNFFWNDLGVLKFHVLVFSDTFVHPLCLDTACDSVSHWFRPYVFMSCSRSQSLNSFCNTLLHAWELPSTTTYFYFWQLSSPIRAVIVKGFAQKHSVVL